MRVWDPRKLFQGTSPGVGCARLRHVILRSCWAGETGALSCWGGGLANVWHNLAHFFWNGPKRLPVR
eukprot:2326563-Alexandrium_andersonii.AAC.1